MTEFSGQQTAHERGMARLNSALRLAMLRKAELPCGEGKWGEFIETTQGAFDEIARLIDSALVDLGKLKARNNLKGGTT